MSELYVLLTFLFIIFVVKTKFYKTRPSRVRTKISFFVCGICDIIDGSVSVLTFGCYRSNLGSTWHISKINQDLATYEIGKDRGVINGDK